MKDKTGNREAPAHGRCRSCGMSIESGPYCRYCIDENGNLQEFDERLRRLVLFMKSRNADLGRQEAEMKALDYMATMPAWRDHPKVVGRNSRNSS